MAEYVATGTTTSNGADFTLADGAAATLMLFGASDGVPAGAVATVQVKTSAATYVQVGTMDSQNPCVQVFGPGTYRAIRQANATTFGITKD